MEYGEFFLTEEQKEYLKPMFREFSKRLDIVSQRENFPTAMIVAQIITPYFLIEDELHALDEEPVPVVCKCKIITGKKCDDLSDIIEKDYDDEL